MPPRESVGEAVWRRLYALAFYGAMPLVLARLFWRGRRQPGYRAHLDERFGHYLVAPKPPLIWLHAVSVGEARAAKPLIDDLRRRFPGHGLFITCMTPTGREAAEALYGRFATVGYLPYDLPHAVRRFMTEVQPSLGIVMETEIWPNLLAAARAAGVPMALVNARLSARSARGYARVAALARPALAGLSAVGAQTADDAARLAALGAPAPVVCGNLKFEVHPAADALALGDGWRAARGPRPVWIAASTREGEEEIVLAAQARLRARPDRPLLVLVPRHPQRFDAAAALAERLGLRVTRRSRGGADAECDVWLGDSMGEMAAFYRMADLAVMGGSLLPYGSQNLIEACACGCPVVLGPSDFNFARAAADAIAAGAARRLAGAPEDTAVAAAVGRLFDAPDELAAMKSAARTFARAHDGATERTLALIAPLVRPASDSRP